MVDPSLETITKGAINFVFTGSGSSSTAAGAEPQPTSARSKEHNTICKTINDFFII
jgi:hypothetical protein